MKLRLVKKGEKIRRDDVWLISNEYMISEFIRAIDHSNPLNGTRYKGQYFNGNKLYRRISG